MHPIYAKAAWFFEKLKEEHDLYMAAAEANKFPIFECGLFGRLMKSKKKTPKPPKGG